MSVLWELARATGLVATATLSFTVAMGLLAAAPTGRAARFLTQALHRNVAGLTVALVVAHVAAVLADSYVPLDLADAVLPLGASYQRVGTALGTLALDVLLVVVVTSALRRRAGARAWRAVHLLTYLLWPLVAGHGLVVGTDDRAVRWLAVAGFVPVVLALLWRLQPRAALR